MGTAANSADWEPLERLLTIVLPAAVRSTPTAPHPRRADFEFMGYAAEGRIHLYRNRRTLRYLNLDGEGNTYQYVPQVVAYEKADADEELISVFL